MHLIDDHALAAGIPVRFAAAKLAEGDTRVLERLYLDTNEQETLEHIICQMEKERGTRPRCCHCRHAFFIYQQDLQRDCCQAAREQGTCAQYGNGPDFDRKIHCPADVCPDYGGSILAYF